jgi:hypothetical protein
MIRSEARSVSAVLADGREVVTLMRGVPEDDEDDEEEGDEEQGEDEEDEGDGDSE